MNNPKQPKEKRDSDFTVLRKLFSLYQQHNRDAFISCILVSLVDGVKPYIPIVLSGILIDALASGTSFSVLLQYTIIGLTISLVVQAISAYLREYFNARVENCMERQNFDLNSQSLKMDYEYLENPEIQEKKRTQEQVVNIRGGLYWMLIWPLDRGLTGLINVITAAFIAVPLFLGNIHQTGYGFLGSNWLTLLLFIILGICVYGGYQTNRRNNKKTKQQFDNYAKCNKLSNYFLHHILLSNETSKDLRIFQQEKLIEEGVHGQEPQIRKLLKRIRILWMKQNCLERTLSNVCGGCIYIYAAIKAYMGLISIGSVVRYASSIVQCVEGLSELLYCLSSWREAIDYGREYLDYINFQSNKPSGTQTIAMRPDNRFLVEFDHVSFKYPGSSTYVIRDLNLKLDIGERMAIVGKNGSGKTTFIKLLCRLYDVTEGTIRLNGKDIREYDEKEYWKLFSVVFQDYRMFSLKVGENIAASETFDKSKVIDALNRAGLENRFTQMEEGLDTYVGKDFEETGVNVSGGERQKMAIARAIYKGAPFIIMDEPTAALDPVSECDVYAGFDKMVGNKTAIYISHRLASCRFCNDILVFDNGRIIQRGNHEKLVDEKGLYQKLWHAQAQYYEI